jgi:hypothetical protein
VIWPCDICMELWRAGFGDVPCSVCDEEVGNTVGNCVESAGAAGETADEIPESFPQCAGQDSNLHPVKD